MILIMISQRINKKQDQGAGLPIEGATAPEEGAKGSDLGELEGSIGAWPYSKIILFLHIFSLCEYTHPRGGGGHVHV
jgi:hypothetical protein